MDIQRIEQFKQSVQKPDEVWQGGLARLPAWVKGENGQPERPWIGIWISLNRGRINMVPPVAPTEATLDLAVGALVASGRGQGMQGYRPGKLMVSDPELGQYLQRILSGANVEVVVVEDDTPIRLVIENMAQSMTGRTPLPGVLEGEGVTPDRVRAFAEAAAEFFRAAPWYNLTDQDLIQVESPKAPINELSHCVVMGAAGLVRGVSFFRSRKQHSDMHNSGDPRRYFTKQGPIWSINFGPIQELPFGDADLFEDEALPVAAENAYPYASGVWIKDMRMVRPNAPTLSFLEGLLRVLTQTTEDELDSGRWSKRVRTADGEVEYTLALPDLLDAMQGKQTQAGANPFGMGARRAMERIMRNAWRMVEEKGLSSPEEINKFLNEEVSGDKIRQLPPSTPAEQAQELVDEAYDAVGRRRIQLARKALSISPDCADAYVLLAEQTGDPQRRLELYRQATTAAERALGPEIFQEAQGHFWSIMETRPYMRARLGLADALRALGKTDEAIEHYQALLKLNPGDNQGVRDILAPLLYSLRRDGELQTLLDEFSIDTGPTLQYLRALLAFRLEGDSPRARKEGAAALKVNRHVKKYLLGEDEVPPGMPPMYSPGSDEEAIYTASELAELWQNTPGAVEWLQKQRSPRQQKPKSPRSPKGKRRK